MSSGNDRVCRVLIVQFMDRFNFCVGGVKRSYIHFVTPERQIIPLDTYNLLYRPGANGNAIPGEGQRELSSLTRSPGLRESASLETWRLRMSNRSSKRANRVPRIVGDILCTIGWLLAAGAGLCTLLLGGSLSSGWDALGLVLICGDVLMLVGGLLAWGGYALWRQGAPSPFGLQPPDVRDDRRTSVISGKDSDFSVRRDK